MMIMNMNMNKQKLLWAFATPSFVSIYLSLYTDQDMFFKREKGKECKKLKI